jgi:hypothetical protein
MAVFCCSLYGHWLVMGLHTLQYEQLIFVTRLIQKTEKEGDQLFQVSQT